MAMVKYKDNQKAAQTITFKGTRCCLESVWQMMHLHAIKNKRGYSNQPVVSNMNKNKKYSR